MTKDIEEQYLLLKISRFYKNFKLYLPEGLLIRGDFDLLGGGIGAEIITTILLFKCRTSYYK